MAPATPATLATYSVIIVISVRTTISPSIKPSTFPAWPNEHPLLSVIVDYNCTVSNVAVPL